MDRNYEGKSSFDFETYKRLIDEVASLEKSEDEEVQKAAQTEVRFIDRAIANIVNYVSTVDNEEHHIRMAYARLEDEALRDAVENADKARRNAHEAAIAATTALNRLAARHCNSIIFTGDATDRLAVADFCLDVTVKLFNERRIVS